MIHFFLDATASLEVGMSQWGVLFRGKKSITSNWSDGLFKKFIWERSEEYFSKGKSPSLQIEVMDF